MAVASLFRFFGFLLIVLSIAQLVPLAVAFALDEPTGIVAFGLSAGVSVFFGVVLVIAGTGGSRKFGRREAVVLAVGAWLLLSMFAAVPLVVGEPTGGLAGALVEATSGLTTTGLTIFGDPGAVARSTVVWRALLQWIGGLATVLFAAALVPQIGLVAPTGSFGADASGYTDSFRPRLRQIAPAVAATYAGLTFLCLIGLLASGLPLLDAACYAMSVISTGGFVPNTGGPMAYGNDGMLLVLVVGMLVGAVSFTLHWAATSRPAAYLKDPETGFLLLLVAAGTAIVFVVLAATPGLASGGRPLYALFEVLSAASTTGFSDPGQGHVPVFVIILLAGFALVGGASASTAGGLKLMRALLLIRQSARELERLVHPHGVMLIKLGRASVTDATMQSIWAFFVLFIFCLILLAAVLSAMGLEFDHALVLALSAMANCGPVLLQAAGYGGDLAILSDSAKLLVAAGMLVGRLEVFSLLVLLTPMFWKR